MPIAGGFAFQKIFLQNKKFSNISTDGTRTGTFTGQSANLRATPSVEAATL